MTHAEHRYAEAASIYREHGDQVWQRISVRLAELSAAGEHDSVRELAQICACLPAAMAVSH